MNKVYKPLFSKDTTGNTRIWYMEQKGDQYRTYSGVKDGNLVISEWSTAEGKNIGKANETLAIYQAESEINAKYKKQLKTGYHEKEEDAHKGTSYVEPMLAQSYNKLSSKKKPNFKTEEFGIQIKFNGNRCVATKEGLFTRKGEVYRSVAHIHNSLKPFFDKYPDAILDGELFNNDLRQRLNEISELIRKTVNVTPEVLENSEKLVKYYIYDGYNMDGMDEITPYKTRKQWIDKNVIPISPYLVEVKTEIIKSEDHMNEIFTRLVEDQQEGGILRRMNSPYEHKRTANLIKLKIDDSDEGLILDITDGDGNWKGAATNVTLKWNGIVFDGVFKGKYEVRDKILKNKQDWIGKTVTFLYMGLTGKGTPNYARVDPDNCFSVDK
jgi:ATP-dependent DNA ligase